MYVQSYGDGYLTNGSSIEMSFDTNDADIAVSRISVNKSILPTKCKNIAVRLEIPDAQHLSISSISYTFKVGKVKER